MPELPEVETLKRSLEKHIVGRKITSYISFRNSLRYKLDNNLANETEGALIISTERIAKYLVIKLDNNNSIVFHLGMTGRLTVRESNYEFQKHDHLIFILDNKNHLVFNDSRRFGMVYTCKSNELKMQKYLRNIGPEPFSKHFNATYLFECFKNKKMPIKSAIMDNKIVVGIGNIYASESLFLSNINPTKGANTLGIIELEKLVKAVIVVLNDAIWAGGTSLRDFVNGSNKPGYFKQKLNVYGRKGQACRKCQTTILKIVQGGRATYFCPQCQR